MAWAKGQSGNPGGRGSLKPFAEALRQEIAAGDHKALRAIAQNLLKLAQSNGSEALAAISMIADRLDGKPIQENINTEKRDATDWSLSELVALFHERRAARERDRAAGGSAREPDSLH